MRLTTGTVFGFADPTILFLIVMAFAIAILVLFIIQLMRIGKLEKKLKTFMKGKDVSSLESEIVGLFKDNKHLTKNAMRNKKEIEEMKRHMLTHVCKVGIVKYDAFQQMGGQLSFALCMLDTEENGFILNSVQSADGCYSYIKEVVAGQSTIELGREEQQALDIAMESIQFSA